MVGYLLSGDVADAFTGLSSRLRCELAIPLRKSARADRVSTHTRSVPAGKFYPKDFRCYHLIVVFPGVARTTGTAGPHYLDKLLADE